MQIPKNNNHALVANVLGTQPIIDTATDSPKITITKEALDHLHELSIAIFVDYIDGCFVIMHKDMIIKLASEKTNKEKLQ